ncbi:MAG: tetratricopeptide repeat protein [Fibrobacterota bacterium]
MARASALVLLLAMLPVLAAPSVSDGVRLFREGQLDSARLFFEKKLIKNKRDREALFYQARLEKDGARSFQKLSAFVSDSALRDVFAEEALLRLGQYHYSRGRYDNAAVMFNQLLNDYPSSRGKSEARVWLGQSYLSLNRAGSAEKAFLETGEELPAAFIRSRAGLAVLFARRGEYDKSNQYLAAALAVKDPALRSTLYYLQYQNARALSDVRVAGETAQKLLSEFPLSLEALELKNEGPAPLPVLPEPPARFEPQHPAPVTQAAPPAAKVVESASGGEERETFTLQMGAFKDRSNAEKLLERLKVRWSEVEIVELKRPAGTLYAVWLGRFDGLKKAESFALAESKSFTMNFRIRKREKNP